MGHLQSCPHFLFESQSLQFLSFSFFASPRSGAHVFVLIVHLLINSHNFTPGHVCFAFLLHLLDLDHLLLNLENSVVHHALLLVDNLDELSYLGQSNLLCFHLSQSRLTFLFLFVEAVHSLIGQVVDVSIRLANTSVNRLHLLIQLVHRIVYTAFHL